MTTRRMTPQACLGTTVIMLSFLASVSQAGLVSTLSVSTDTGYDEAFEIAGSPLPGDAWFWTSQIATSEFTASISMMGEPGTPSLGTSLQVVNGTTESMEMSIDFIMPIDMLANGELEWYGSQAASLNGTDVILASLLDVSVWSASLGEDAFAMLLDAPFELQVNGTGSNATSDSSSGTLTWAGGETLSVHYLFELSGGASVQFNGGVGLLQVPAAPSLALLLAAGLAGRTRRRGC
jgi:hypothetical protein